MLKVAEESLQLSMGMSNDFEEAIRMGSTNIRYQLQTCANLPFQNAYFHHKVRIREQAAHKC